MAQRVLGTLWISRSCPQIALGACTARRAGTKLANVPSSAAVVVALRLASTLHEHSDLIRLRSRMLAEAGAQMRWQSPATVLFTQQLEAVLASLDRCVAQFDLACEDINQLAVVG